MKASVKMIKMMISGKQMLRVHAQSEIIKCDKEDGSNPNFRPSGTPDGIECCLVSSRLVLTDRLLVCCLISLTFRKNHIVALRALWMPIRRLTTDNGTSHKASYRTSGQRSHY